MYGPLALGYCKVEIGREIAVPSKHRPRRYIPARGSGWVTDIDRTLHRRFLDEIYIYIYTHTHTRTHTLDRPGYRDLTGGDAGFPLSSKPKTTLSLSVP